MTLNFNPYIREPGNAAPGPDQTLTAFDLPKMYVESYGVHNIEYQHTTIVQSEKDPDFIKELKARLDESSVKMTQINLEFGMVQSISHKDPEGRRQAVEHVKQWIDIAAQYGCPRVMINQQQMQLTNETRAGAVEAMKAMADYGRPKNVKVSAETRGAGTPEYVQQIGGVKPWEFMIGVIKDAGAASNVDIGNVGAMNQQELHDCIKGWFRYSSGNMHIKSSPFWDVGQAVKFTESLGYQGLARSRSRDTRPCGRLQHDPGEPAVEGTPVSGRRSAVGESGTGWGSAVRRGCSRRQPSAAVFVSRRDRAGRTRAGRAATCAASRR